MADTVEVRLLRGTFDAGRGRDVDLKTADDTFEVKAGTLDAHPELERVDDEDEANDENDADGADDEFDAEAFVDRTPMENVIADVDAGEADGHLDAVADAASREGVKDAVDARRKE